MQIDPSWQLLIALAALVATTTIVSRFNHLHKMRTIVVAALRATIQLAGVSLIIIAAISHLWSALLFLVGVFAVAVYTTTGRVGTRSVWWWSALAMACGLVPVLVIIYLSGAAPFNGFSLIPIGSIITGNTMTAHTLMGRRVFPTLDAELGTYEAALALGMMPDQAVRMVLNRIAAEPLVPNLDATRTVGLVTLPGAFVGVLLGGGSTLQAGASQLLVLIGIMAGQTITIAVANHLVAARRLLPTALKEKFHP